jgi:hypothetical protein
MNLARSFHAPAAWPPLPLTLIFAIAYGLFEGSLWLLQRTVPYADLAISGSPDLYQIRVFILAAAAGCCALSRLWRLHPGFNWAYAGWLRQTPWTADHPLPYGPIHPAWQDLAAVGALTALALWLAQIPLWWPAAGFAGVYLALLTLVLLIARLWKFCLLLGFLWPALLLPGMAGWPTAGLLLVVILVTWQGNQAALRLLACRCRPNPFSLDGSESPGQPFLQMSIGPRNRPDLLGQAGWPYAALSTRVRLGPIPRSTSFFLSLLFGWWTFCACSTADTASLAGFVIFFAIVAALARLVIYCDGRRPPFTLRGRLVSGRLLVPGFDQVFLTPLAVVLLSVAGAVLILHSGPWRLLAEAGIVALLWFVLLDGGPTFRHWHLTGQHRARPPKLASGKVTFREV